MALKAEEVYAILKKQIQSGGGTPGPAGVGIQKIEKTGTNGLVDTYTITYTNGQTTTYTVTNGADGPKGDKGDKGDTGQKGDPGTTPEIGENGNWYLGEIDTGKPSRGEQGPKGEQGPQGEQGETGEQGPPGQTGPAGQTGATPNIQIGTVQTLEPGQQATASMSGTAENPLLNLGIPKGENAKGNSYELPIMSSTQLGGGKAVAKTDEDVPVAVDPSTGQLFVPTYPESASADIPRQEMQNTNTNVILEPNKLYVFPEMASLTVALGTPSDANVENEYHFFFTSGATATTLTLNDVLSDAYSIEANMKYEVSILEGVAYIKGVSMSET